MVRFFIYYMKNCKQGGKKSEKSKRACSSIRDFRVQMSFKGINCFTSNHLSLFDIKTQEFKHLVAMKLHDSNHLIAEAVTEQKVVITIMILILSLCHKKSEATTGEINIMEW